MKTYFIPIVGTPISLNQDTQALVHRSLTATEMANISWESFVDQDLPFGSVPQWMQAEVQQIIPCNFQGTPDALVVTTILGPQTVPLFYQPWPKYHTRWTATGTIAIFLLSTLQESGFSLTIKERNQYFLNLTETKQQKAAREEKGEALLGIPATIVGPHPQEGQLVYLPAGSTIHLIRLIEPQHVGDPVKILFNQNLRRCEEAVVYESFLTPHMVLRPVPITR